MIATVLFVIGIIIIIIAIIKVVSNAQQKSIVLGGFCLLIPPYNFYYALVHYHGKVIIILMLWIVGGVFQILGYALWSEADSAFLTKYGQWIFNNNLFPSASKKTIAKTTKASIAQEKTAKNNNLRATTASLDNLLKIRNQSGFRTRIIPNLYRSLGQAPLPPAYIFKKVFYSSPAGKLAAYLTPPPTDGKKYPTIIWLHGNLGGIGKWLWDDYQYTGAFRKSGFVVMCPSLRAQNNNPGRFELFYGEVEDIVHAIAYLRKLSYVDSQRIYVIGHDIGGTLALLTAQAVDNIRAVFSIGGAADIHDALRFEIPEECIPFDYTIADEISMRSAIHFTSLLQAPTFYFVDPNSPYANKARKMQLVARKAAVPLKVFANAQNLSHVLQPLNELIAKKISIDTGPTCKISFRKDNIRKAFYRYTNRAEIFYRRGSVHFNQKKFTAAVKYFTQAIAATRNFFKAYYMRALAYTRQGKLAQALVDYNYLLQTNPRYAPGYYGRGAVLLRKGNRQLAVRDFQKYLQVAPQGIYAKKVRTYLLKNKLSPRQFLTFRFRPPTATIARVNTIQNKFFKIFPFATEEQQETVARSQVTYNKTRTGYLITSNSKYFSMLINGKELPAEINKLLENNITSYQFNRRGKLLKIFGNKKLIRKLRQTLPASLAPFYKAKNLLAREKANWYNTIERFVDRRVAIGEVWQNKAPVVFAGIAMPLAATCITRFSEQINYAERNCVRIQTASVATNRALISIVNTYISKLNLRGRQFSIAYMNLQAHKETLMDPKTMLIFQEDFQQKLELKFELGKASKIEIVEHVEGKTYYKYQ